MAMDRESPARPYAASGIHLRGPCARAIGYGGLISGTGSSSARSTARKLKRVLPKAGAGRRPKPTLQHARVLGGNILDSFARLQRAFDPEQPQKRRNRATIMERATVLSSSFEQSHSIRSRTKSFHIRGGVMLYIAIGVLLLLVLAGAGLYVRRDQSRAVVSTSEWVRLMRKNDMRNDRATKTRAIKSSSS